MTDLLVGVIAGAKLAVFTVLLAYVYLLYRSSTMHGGLLLLAVAFVVMVLGELVYAFGQTDATPLPWLTRFENLQLFADVLKLGAIIGAGLFLRSFRDRLEG